jgi:hypothetical protein
LITARRLANSGTERIKRSYRRHKKGATNNGRAFF